MLNLIILIKKRHRLSVGKERRVFFKENAHFDVDVMTSQSPQKIARISINTLRVCQLTGQSTYV